MNTGLLILMSTLMLGCSLQLGLALTGWLHDDANRARNSAAADWHAFRLALAQPLAAHPRARPRLVGLTVRAGALQRSTASAMMDRDAA